MLKGKLKVSMFLVLVNFCFTMSQRVSAPECTDGSPATCVCGDGSQPDYSTFPPCPLKKVKFLKNVIWASSTCENSNILIKKLMIA